MTKKAQRMLALMDRTTRLWHIPNVGRAKGRVIRRLIERQKSTRAVEIGSLLGYSAILIAGSLPPRGRLTCLETSDYLARMTKQNVEEAGLGRKVKVIQGDALRLLPLLPGRFDFVFITPRKRTTSTICARSSPSSWPAPWSWPTTPASSARKSRPTSITSATPRTTRAASTSSTTTRWR